MQAIEIMYSEMAEQHFPDQRWDMQIQCLVNKTSPQRALPMGTLCSECLQNGDTVVCFGEAQLTGMIQPPEKPETDKIPVTILTGFLGAGKTTFLNYILTEQK